MKSRPHSFLRIAGILLALILGSVQLPGAVPPGRIQERPGQLEGSQASLRNPQGWREAEPGYRFAFPRDHASHPDYGLEWWYYTGNLRSPAGRRFGYELTFFRIGVERAPANPSRWAVRDLYMTHFAISDIDRNQFHFAERMNSVGVGWAGAAADQYRVWNEDWSVRPDRADDGAADGAAHVLAATDGDDRLDLRLMSVKPPAIHGENGISQKGPSAGNASHYYSLTRLDTSGRLTVAGETFDVTGLSWMDHEFGTSFLEQEEVGWDWFSIQLDDRRELMLFEIRRRDGTIDPSSSGTLIESDGRTTHLAFDDFALVPSEVWNSAATGAAYPLSWRIELPGYRLNLTARVAFANQEATGAQSNMQYWEGSVTVAGDSAGSPINGAGYLEMTGYAGPNMGTLLR